MQQQGLEWRIATALGSPIAMRGVSPALLLPLLFILSVIVLLLAPKGTTAMLAPTAGAIALLIELLLLARLVFRMHLAMLQLGEHDPQTQARVRRCLLSAVNVLFGLMIFTLMFYPLSSGVIDASRGSGSARLLWMLTVGGAIVTLAFGQMVSLLLDVVRDKIPPLQRAPD
ncbi:hypothetical protein [Hydrocarboniphaga sp.]|uniref:hypothetical protein n=1 Tax=Hydrocarboniphaga sp. TaxID=2033016 RepID=UPI003D13471D